MARKLISDEQRNYVCELVIAGTPLNTVKLVTDISKPTIYKILQAAKIKPRNKQGAYHPQAHQIQAQERAILEFGDIYGKRTIFSNTRQIRTYFDPAVNHEVKVYETRFATNYRGAGI